MFPEWPCSFRLVVPFEFGGVEMIFERDQEGKECAVRIEKRSSNGK